MTPFINGLPKVELHLHIEGTLEPELMLELSKRNSLKIPYNSIDEIKHAYHFSNLQDFLNIYYQGMSVLLHEQDFYDLTKAYLAKVQQQNVRHVEIFFDPQAHTERGVSFDVVIKGILAALTDAEQEWGITSKLIACFLRHLSEEAAFETLELALPYKDSIIALGLDSSEVGNPPSKFARVFSRAREEGFLTVAHAGEEGPSEYVEEALDLLKVSRVDHGNRLLDDEALTARVRAQQVALTVCPLSNLKLCVVNELANHPLKQMLNLGLRATINSDDPAYFGGYMNENYQAVTDALKLEKKELIQLATNAIEASFANEERKEQLRQELKTYAKGVRR